MCTLDDGCMPFCHMNPFLSVCTDIEVILAVCAWCLNMFHMKGLQWLYSGVLMSQIGHGSCSWGGVGGQWRGAGREGMKGWLLMEVEEEGEKDAMRLPKLGEGRKKGASRKMMQSDPGNMSLFFCRRVHLQCIKQWEQTSACRQSVREKVLA